jgi:hypothetical protein
LIKQVIRQKIGNWELGIGNWEGPILNKNKYKNSIHGIMADNSCTVFG